MIAYLCDFPVDGGLYVLEIFGIIWFMVGVSGAGLSIGLLRTKTWLGKACGAMVGFVLWPVLAVAGVQAIAGYYEHEGAQRWAAKTFDWCEAR